MNLAQSVVHNCPQRGPLENLLKAKIPEKLHDHMLKNAQISLKNIQLQEM